MAGVGDGNILPIGGLMERTLRLQKKQFALGTNWHTQKTNQCPSGQHHSEQRNVEAGSSRRAAVLDG